LPNTLVESMACSVPCVAFAIGGMKDLIRTTSDGLLVDIVNAENLAAVIEAGLSDSQRFAPRKSSEKLRAENVVVERYNAIYQGALKC